MKRRIVKVSPMGMGHLMLELEDGTSQTVHRGDHETHKPMPGNRANSWECFIPACSGPCLQVLRVVA
jgi:hypothetical protein